MRARPARAPAPPRARVPARAGAAGGVAVLALSFLSACTSQPAASPRATARAFLSGWAGRDWAAMRRLAASPPADFASVNASALDGLGARRISFVPGRLGERGAAATEPVTERLEIPGVGTMTIRTVLRLVQRSGRWLVPWSPATIAPPLRAGGRLSLRLTWPPRAPILGAGGVPLTTRAPLVTIGVEGARIRHRASLIASLVAAGASRQQAAAAVAAAKTQPTWFEPVFTVTAARYARLKRALYPIPGTVFQRTSTRTAITPGLAVHVVGAVGPVTAAELRSLGPGYDAASVVGQSGLEFVYQRQLAGSPGAAVTVLNRAGAPVATIARLSPRPGAAVRTTIDPRLQRAAEAALAVVRKQAALIAVDATTGAVLASVSVPGSQGFDLALAGAFPPGSSFKVITSTALIEHGLTPSSPVSCPQAITAGGEVFRNAPGMGPAGDLLRAFAESCNTAFIGLATGHLRPADLPHAAAQFRIGMVPRPGLPAFGGSVPVPANLADLAATAIGQGRVLVSPLAMAAVAAAADSGIARAPRLVSGAPDDGVPGRRLPAAVVRDLHLMMAEVVAAGTAANRGLPAGTYAKTGTAQYGTGHRLHDDAWLIGFRGRIAFAMVTVNGGEGGPTDGPVVARFLRSLGR